MSLLVIFVYEGVEGVNSFITGIINPKIIVKLI